MATLQRIVGLTFALLWIGNVASGAPDLTATYAGCNLQTYEAGDGYASSVVYIVSALESATPSIPGYDYYISSTYPAAIVYGHAACNPALSVADCITCIDYVKTDMLIYCPNNIGAQLVLHDCRMRYEHHPFTE